MTRSEHKLQERLLLSRVAPDDRLMLADATLQAALDGSRALTPNERRALQSSPLTLRRFRQLCIERGGRRRGRAAQAANDAPWLGSTGMLRAASCGAALDELLTDDGHWALHFLPHQQDEGWQLILKLDAAAPFAARLLAEQPLLRVVDGGGALLLQGRLDADGECERAWPYTTAPMAHFQLHGATFAVEPVAR